MPAPRKFSDEQYKEILALFHSDKSGPDVASLFSCDFHRTIRKIWLAEFGEHLYKERISRLCRIHKVGNKNPMYGRIKDRHPRYTEVTFSTQGYRLVPVPDWYTGPVDKGRVAEHILVACKAAGITELPEAHVVHHKDENKLNNHPDNLEIISRASHMQKHRWIRHKKKVQRLERKARRLQEEPKRTTT